MYNPVETQRRRVIEYLRPRSRELNVENQIHQQNPQKINGNLKYDPNSNF